MVVLNFCFCLDIGIDDLVQGSQLEGQLEGQLFTYARNEKSGAGAPRGVSG